MIRKPVRGEHRTVEQLREHYEVEKELASRLRKASRQERYYLYSSLYDELYRRVPHHPQLTRKSSPEETIKVVSSQMGLLKRFLDKGITFLEVGPGDCALSFEVAKFVKKVYAVDVSEEITKSSITPRNFQLLLSDGCSIPVPPNSIDVAYSHELLEHLHPDDAFEHLQNIYNVLIPGGIYICITPNQVGGPSDISMYFDTVATGFHLKEYTLTELSNLFENIGFSKVRVYVGTRGKYTRFLVFSLILFEKLLITLPYAFRNQIAHSLPVISLLWLVGIK